MKTPRGYSFVVSFILVGIMTGCALTQFFMQHNMLGSVLWGIAALTWLIKGLWNCTAGVYSPKGKTHKRIVWLINVQKSA